MIILASLFPALLPAQNKPGNWLMYFGQHRLSDRVSMHTEAQYRNHTVVPVNVEQLLLRTGLNYHLNSQAMFSGGYAYVASHDFDSEQVSPESVEHRIWQQFITTQLLAAVKLEHRYRAEQRWINGRYRNRLRYRLMVFLPLNKPTIEPGAVFFGLYDEIFVNTRAIFFDRNRLYAALGYQLNRNLSIQAGLLQQQVNDFGKNYLQLAVVWNLDWRREEKDH